MQCLLGHERFPPCAHSHRRPRHRLPKAAQAAPLLASGIAATLSTPLDREKLPIYSQSDIEILVQQVFSELERQIDRVKAIISPEESLTPEILYVGVATLSGSILARNRALPLRILLPPVLLALNANHFLSKTSCDLASYLLDLEDTYL
ncbi:hypothetical protein Moror_6090 [Moniliophthora roreri MCA 2997]|uniref:MICOS complex subunit n=1 Tax=Moniliophthora roreri (strain MCA 2997) TaxID=1381753 RepID=V2WSM7_MONRO|nr:hypothetical protein Moror_6090 [Moniliophthora roreri MCA 2997]